VTLLANIPTVIVSGNDGAAKAALIERLLGSRPGGETWAVLASADGAARLASRPGVVLASAGGGCVCCTARVALRVGLTRLLRGARPARLIIELDAASHVAESLRTLRSPWLAPVLAVEAVIEAREGGEVASDPATLAAFQGTSVRDPR
jgi:G3E family GTPase